MKVTALAPWQGSKRTMAPRIVELLGPHRAYIEPFWLALRLGPVILAAAFGCTGFQATCPGTCLFNSYLRRVDFYRLATDRTGQKTIRVADSLRNTLEAAVNSCAIAREKGLLARGAGSCSRPGNLKMLDRQGDFAYPDTNGLQLLLVQNFQSQQRMSFAEEFDFSGLCLIEPAFDLVVNAVTEKIRRVSTSIGQSESLRFIGPLFSLCAEPIGKVNLPSAAHVNRLACRRLYPKRLSVSARFAEAMALASASAFRLLAARFERSFLASQRPRDFGLSSWREMFAAEGILLPFHVCTHAPDSNAVTAQPVVNCPACNVVARQPRTIGNTALFADIVLNKPLALLEIFHCGILRQIQRRNQLGSYKGEVL